MTSLALMITTVLCYSATSGIVVADCGKACRVDMGNVGSLTVGNSGSLYSFEASAHGSLDSGEFPGALF